MSRQIKLSRIKAWLIDLFFPNRCPICRHIITYDELVCGKCLNKLEKLRAEDKDIMGKCGNVCRAAVSVYYYEKEAKSGIISLKGENLNFGKHLGKELSRKIKANEIMKSADMVTYVPMNRQKKRERGYNQAEVIAAEISRNTGIPLVSDLLFKDKSEQQHTLSRKDRMINVTAFYCNTNKDLSGKRIIICDDVITTGSTLGRCTGLLKGMNAAEVYIAAGTTTIFKKE